MLLLCRCMLPVKALAKLIPAILCSLGKQLS
jgi:hypothetical protein